MYDSLFLRAACLSAIRPLAARFGNWLTLSSPIEVSVEDDPCKLLLAPPVGLEDMMLRFAGVLLALADPFGFVLGVVCLVTPDTFGTGRGWSWILVVVLPGAVGVQTC